MTGSHKTLERVGSICLLAGLSNEPRARPHARACDGVANQPQSGAQPDCPRRHGQTSQAIQPSRDAVTAIEHQADDGPNGVALAVTSRRRSSVPRCHEEHADLPEPTPMLAEAKLDLCVLFLLVASPRSKHPDVPSRTTYLRSRSTPGAEMTNKKPQRPRCTVIESSSLFIRLTDRLTRGALECLGAVGSSPG